MSRLNLEFLSHVKPIKIWECPNCHWRYDYPECDACEIELTSKDRVDIDG